MFRPTMQNTMKNKAEHKYKMKREIPMLFYGEQLLLWVQLISVKFPK